MRVTSVESWFRQAGEWVRTTGTIFKGGMRVTADSDVTPPVDPEIIDRDSTIFVPTEVKSWRRERGELIRAAGSAIQSGIQTTTIPDGEPPSKVTGLTAVPGDGQVDLSWDAATDDTGIDKYELQYRINRQILSLDGSYTYPDAESLQESLMTRHGVFSIDYFGKTYVGVLEQGKDILAPTVDSWFRDHGELILCNGVLPKGGMQVIPRPYSMPLPDAPIEGTFISFSREDFTNVTFEDIEIGAKFISGMPGLVVRSNNGEGPYGWSAYVAIFTETGVSVYKSTMGVLGLVLVSYSGSMKDKWCAFRAEGTRLSVRVNDVEVCYCTDADYYNGVVGITCGVDGGVWNFGLNDWQTLVSSPSRIFSHTGLTDGLEYQYRVRAIDVDTWTGEWSTVVSGIPIYVSHDAFVDIDETVMTTIELTFLVLASPEMAVDHSETVTTTIGLTLLVSSSPSIAVPISETITTTPGLTLVVTSIVHTSLPVSETITTTPALTLVVTSIVQTALSVSETITTTPGLTLTISSV